MPSWTLAIAGALLVAVAYEESPALGSMLLLVVVMVMLTNAFGRGVLKNT